MPRPYDGERLPFDVFEQDRSENGFSGLVGSSHCDRPYLNVLIARAD